MDLGTSSAAIYDGRTGEELTLAQCHQGHIYTYPALAAGCPRCAAPSTLIRELEAAGLNVKVLR